MSEIEATSAEINKVKNRIETAQKELVNRHCLLDDLVKAGREPSVVQLEQCRAAQQALLDDLEELEVLWRRKEVLLWQQGTGLTLDQYLGQQLANMNFFGTTTPTTGEFPPPTWKFEVWPLDHSSLMADVQEALTSCGTNAQVHAAAEGPALNGGRPTVRISGVLGKRPDYELFDGSGRTRSFLEFKIPPLLDAAGSASLASLSLEARQGPGRPQASALPIAPGAVLSNLFGQVEAYFRLRKVRYFAISTYCYTWLCYARDQCVYVSEGFASDCTEPTAMQALFWLSTKALGDDGILSDAEVAEPQQLPAGDESSRSSCTGSGSEDAKWTEASSSSQSHDSPAPDESSSEGRVAVQYVPGVEEVLGTGATGPVYAGSLDGVPVAVKWTEAGSYAAQALQHEASMLRLVQGPFTPQVMFAGLSACGRWFLLLTSRVFGRMLEEDDVHLLPSALAALRHIHSKGLCHGDVELRNFMKVESGTQAPNALQPNKGEGGQRVIALDLGRAKACSSDEEKQWKQLEEEEQLCALLGREMPGDVGLPEGSSQTSARTSQRGNVNVESIAGRHVANRVAAVMGQPVNRRRLEPGARMVPCPAVHLCPRLQRAVGPKPMARPALNKLI